MITHMIEALTSPMAWGTPFGIGFFLVCLGIFMVCMSAFAWIASQSKKTK